jgi:hypothetical protein
VGAGAAAGGAASGTISAAGCSWTGALSRSARSTLQIERPNVPAYRRLVAVWWRSSKIGASGRLLPTFSHVAPASRVTNTPKSLATKTESPMTLMSLTGAFGRSPVMFSQSSPPSVVRRTYAASSPDRKPEYDT